MFENVRIARKAHLSHGGKVSTRTLITSSGEMKSLGVMQPGTYRLTTEAPQTLEITQGHCRVKLSGDQAWTDYEAGQSFSIPENSHYEIEVEDTLDYICHFDVSSES